MVGRRHARNLVKQHRPTIVVLMETYIVNSHVKRDFGKIWVMKWVLFQKPRATRVAFGLW